MQDKRFFHAHFKVDRDLQSSVVLYVLTNQWLLFSGTLPFFLHEDWFSTIDDAFSFSIDKLCEDASDFELYIPMPQPLLLLLYGSNSCWPSYKENITFVMGVFVPR